MAKKQSKKHSSQAAGVLPGRSGRATNRRPLVVVVLAVALLIVVLAAHWTLVRQPVFVVGLLGLLCAAAVVAIFWFATHEPDHDELALRMQKGQHPDFGRRLRTSRKERRKIKLPLLGSTSLRAIGAAAMFVVVFAWWLTPWSPVAIAEAEREDLSGPLTEEALATVLVMPDPYLATLQPPIVPAKAKQLALDVDEEDTSYHRAQKAVVDLNLGEARRLLEAAQQEGGADPFDVSITKGQGELYSYHFAEALDSFREALKQKPEDRRALALATVAAMHAGRLADAETHIQGAMRAVSNETWRPEDGDEAQRELWQAAVLHLRAVLCTLRGSGTEDYAEAERLYDQVKELQQKDGGVGRKHAYFAATLNNQAILYQLRGKLAAVGVLLNEASNIWKNALDPEHLHVAASQGNLAMFHCLEGQYDDALQCNQEAAQIRNKVLETQPTLRALAALSQLNTAVLDEALANYAPVQKLGEDALKTFSEDLGAEHLNVAAAHNLLAANFAAGAQYLSIALQNAHSAEKIVKKILVEPNGEDDAYHAYHAVTLNLVAEILLDQQQNTLARQAAEQALSIAEKSCGKEHPVAAAARRNLARSAMAEGNAALARSYLNKALRIDKNAMGEESLETAVTMSDLAALDGTVGDGSGGIDGYREALKIAETVFGEEHPDHPIIAWLLVGQARVLTDHDRVKTALPLVQRALEMQEKVYATFQPNHPELADTLELYATVLRKLSPPQTDRAAQMEARAKAMRARLAGQEQEK